MKVKTKPELLEEIEELKASLEHAECRLEDANDSLGELQNENCELEYLSESKDITAEKAYFAGFNSNYSEAMKGWLNYKIEAEL